jgi:paraquat-inducible protein B
MHKEKIMSKPANKTLIGAFVVGALALAVIAVVVFGSGRFFGDKSVDVMYFEGSVKGLNVGSPVVFRGVRIGSVKNIILQFDTKDMKAIIPVYVEIDYNKITPIQGWPKDGEADSYFKELKAKGLRAQLEMQSLVTGQLMINIDFFPGTPLKLVGLDKDHQEIPTIPSGIDQFLKEAQEIPLKELVERALKTIESIDRTINSKDLAASLASLAEGLKEAKLVLVKVNKEIDPLLANLKDITGSAKEIAKNSEGVPQQIGQALASAQNTLKQTEITLKSASAIASENSTVMIEVQNTMRELTKTSRSVRFLADYLQRYPESLITGKKTAKGE